jgi:hypothetical protein
MSADPEEDFSFTYCGDDWSGLSDETKAAIAAVARAAYDVLKKEDVDED